MLSINIRDVINVGKLCIWARKLRLLMISQKRHLTQTDQISMHSLESYMHCISWIHCPWFKEPFHLNYWSIMTPAKNYPSDKRKKVKCRLWYGVTVLLIHVKVWLIKCYNGCLQGLPVQDYIYTPKEVWNRPCSWKAPCRSSVKLNYWHSLSQ